MIDLLSVPEVFVYLLTFLKRDYAYAEECDVLSKVLFFWLRQLMLVCGLGNYTLHLATSVASSHGLVIYL